MHHPLEEGWYYQESHFPEVQIFRKKGIIQIKIWIKPHLQTLFQERYPETWTFHQYLTREWCVYVFSFKTGSDSHHISEIRSLNALLNYCWTWSSGNDTPQTCDIQQAQLAFVSAKNPQEFGMGAYGPWANFAKPVTEALSSLSSYQPLEEYVTSRMRGAHKIIAPQNKLSRIDNRMHCYRSGNPLPIFTTFGNCACLSTTSNTLEHDGGFQSSPHNVDSYSQQFLLMVGVLICWARIRKMIQDQNDHLLSSSSA